MRNKKKTNEVKNKGKLRLCNKTQREMRKGGHGRLGLECVFIRINITDTERCFFWVEGYPFADMTCFCMSSDGRKSIHLFDEKSSNHFYNPGRLTECSDPVWDPPQMGRAGRVSSVLVTKFAGEESTRLVRQRREVKQIQKESLHKTTAAFALHNKVLSSLLQVASL